MELMKVLLLASGYPRWKGDITNIYLHRLARSLKDEDIVTHVACPHAPGLKEEEEIDGVFIHRFRYAYPAGLETLAYFPGIPERMKTLNGRALLPPFLGGMLMCALRICRKYEVDVVNAHWALPSGLVSALLKTLTEVPFLVTLYGAELWPIIDRRNFAWKATRYVLTGADDVVAISDATAEAGKTISGREDIGIVPDGIDTQYFNDAIDREKARMKFGISDCFVVSSSGRMVERKGFKYLVEAMPEVIRVFPNTKLIIGGEGPEKDKIVRAADELGVTDNICLPGFISEEDFADYLRASDVFVLPSIVDSSGDTEGSATILLEAMACGTPVVGTRVGGVPYAIKEGKGGFLVDQRNPCQLSAAIISLLTDKKKRFETGAAGREYVAKNFSLRRTAKLYVERFTSIRKKYDT